MPSLTVSFDPEYRGAFAAAVDSLVATDYAMRAKADSLHLRLTKPPGSLGRLEAVGAQLSAISGVVPPPIPRPVAVAIFAGDHGVHEEAVSPWPQEVTAQMVANFAGGGAAINSLAGQADADVYVIDAGVASTLPEIEGVIDRKIASGTRNLARGAAMTAAQALEALDAGAGIARDLTAGGYRCLLTGDMGIANTTPTAALIAAFTGRSSAEVTGRGTGIDDETLERKAAIVADAVSRTVGFTPLEVLAEVGGFEIAELAGFIVGAAAAKVPVLIDGVIACAALITAVRLAPHCLGYVIAGHRSVEPGATAVMDALDLEPLIELDLRLGEGSGAALAFPIVEAAARVMNEMATFDSAGVDTHDL